jgi:hypothetical protein
LLGFALQALVGDADHLHTHQLQLLLAQAISLEGSTSPVSLEDVEFDRKTLLGPVDVQLVARDVEASRRPR